MRAAPAGLRMPRRATRQDRRLRLLRLSRRRPDLAGPLDFRQARLVQQAAWRRGVAPAESIRGRAAGAGAQGVHRRPPGGHGDRAVSGSFGHADRDGHAAGHNRRVRTREEPARRLFLLEWPADGDVGPGGRISSIAPPALSARSKAPPHSESCGRFAFTSRPPRVRPFLRSSTSGRVSLAISSAGLTSPERRLTGNRPEMGSPPRDTGRRVHQV